MGTTGNISLSSLHLARLKNYSNIRCKEIKIQSLSFSPHHLEFLPATSLEYWNGIVLEWNLFDACRFILENEMEHHEVRIRYSPFLDIPVQPVALGVLKF